MVWYTRARRVTLVIMGSVVAACGGVVAVTNEAVDGGGTVKGAGGGTGATRGNVPGGKGGTTAAAGGAPVTLLPDGGCPDPSAPIYDGIRVCLDRAIATDVCERRASMRSPGDPIFASCGAGCLCTYCVAEWFQCDTDLDCTRIMLCAAAHNCTGAGCYTPETCQAVIDGSDNGAGLTSLATALAQVLMSCATKITIGAANYADRPGPVCQPGCPSTK